jgi:5-methylcytosine-specific restriction endonuclease McrA
MSNSEMPPKLKAYIIAHLRRIGYRNVHRKQAFAAAHKGLAQWECNACKQIFGSSRDLHGDHVIPIIDVNIGFTTWDDYIYKLFLGELQALCVDCHKLKSKKENEIRYETRRKQKTRNKT